MLRSVWDLYAQDTTLEILSKNIAKPSEPQQNVSLYCSYNQRHDNACYFKTGERSHSLRTVSQITWPVLPWSLPWVQLCQKELLLEVYLASLSKEGGTVFGTASEILAISVTVGLRGSWSQLFRPLRGRHWSLEQTFSHSNFTLGTENMDQDQMVSTAL